jgi:hypothetical protein
LPPPLCKNAKTTARSSHVLLELPGYFGSYLPRTAATYFTSYLPHYKYYCHFELDTYDLRRHTGTTYLINLEMVLLTYQLPVYRVPSSCSTACTVLVPVQYSSLCRIQVQDTHYLVPLPVPLPGTRYKLPVLYHYSTATTHLYHTTVDSK